MWGGNLRAFCNLISLLSNFEREKCPIPILPCYLAGVIVKMSVIFAIVCANFAFVFLLSSPYVREAGTFILIL